LAFISAVDAQTAPPAPNSIEGHLAAGKNTLKASGTKEQMAKRLAGIDPSGLVLGYPGRLFLTSRGRWSCATSAAIAT